MKFEDYILRTLHNLIKNDASYQSKLIDIKSSMYTECADGHAKTHTHTHTHTHTQIMQALIMCDSAYH